MHYRSLDNRLYFIDPGFESMLPPGCVAIPDDEAEILRLTLLPKIDPKVEAQNQINDLERQHLAPRFLREYLLADFAAKAAAAGKSPSALPAYVKLKALDDQIAALRALLV